MQAYSKYLKDGIVSVQHREGSTSRFVGVHWDKHAKKWTAKCKGTYLGVHTAEEAAARAYNVEAERIGYRLNVIPPTGAAGAGGGAGTGTGPKHTTGAGTAPKRAGAGAAAGSKRTAPQTSAAASPSRKMKL